MEVIEVIRVIEVIEVIEVDHCCILSNMTGQPTRECAKIKKGRYKIWDQVQ
jgi:hypothetical protein